MSRRAEESTLRTLRGKTKERSGDGDDFARGASGWGRNGFDVAG